MFVVTGPGPRLRASATVPSKLTDKSVVFLKNFDAAKLSKEKISDQVRCGEHLQLCTKSYCTN